MFSLVPAALATMARGTACICLMEQGVWSSMLARLLWVKLVYFVGA